MKPQPATRPAGPGAPTAINRASELVVLILAEYASLLSAGQHQALADAAPHGPEARLNLLLGQLAARGALGLLPAAWRTQAEIIAEVWAARNAPAEQDRAA